MAKRRNARVRKSSTKNWGARGVSKAVPATVIIPSGACPYIVESTELSDIQDWVSNVTKEKASVVTYKRSVYTYWLRHSFDINSQEYRAAKKIVEDIVPETVKNVDDLGFEID